MNSVEKGTVLHCLKSMIDEEVCEECPLYGTTGTDHCEKDCVMLAINALEQEPCEDAISRQAVQTELKNCEVVNVRDENDNFIGYYNADTVDSIVRNLPPVTPQPKTGRWIYNKNLSTHYGDVYTCSECGERCLESCYEHIEKLPDFCPKCHIKMEVEE